jgi:hypothetical protein
MKADVVPQMEDIGERFGHFPRLRRVPFQIHLLVTFQQAAE